ncbi:Anoctamin [Operophtera brumata]|uniref:Anoctamin n=1 Tax=Operophtera brumata TaxID=104452 RepID=A0A0L7KWV8_OPEBR|nr:Anoctamin [Operophtera brumata]
MLYQNVVALVMIIVRWAIPDMSAELRDRIRREAYVINTFILQETRARSRGTPTPQPQGQGHAPGQGRARWGGALAPPAASTPV